MEGENESKTIREAFCERLKAARPGLILAGAVLAWYFAVPMLVGLGLAWAVKSAASGKVSPSPVEVADYLTGSGVSRFMEFAGSIKESLQGICNSFTSGNVFNLTGS